MGFEEVGSKLERSNFYKFTTRHKKFINIIQGFFIIGLLIAINLYIYKDHQIKKQIADHCGYESSIYECICDKRFVDEWKEQQKGNFEINFTGEIKDVQVDR